MKISFRICAALLIKISRCMNVSCGDIPSYPFLDYYHSILSNDDPLHSTTLENYIDNDHTYTDDAIYIEHSNCPDDQEINELGKLNQVSDARQTSVPIEVSDYCDLNDMSPWPFEESLEAFDPDNLFRDDDTPPREQNSEKAQRRKPKKQIRVTPYWQSLRYCNEKKKELIDVYAGLTLTKGKPISRHAAGHRLRYRCTHEIAENLLSGDSSRVQLAKFILDDGAKWSGSILSPSDKVKLRDILIDHYNVGLQTAARIISRGFRALSVANKMSFASCTKDPKVLSDLARKMHNAYLRQRRSEYRDKGNGDGYYGPSEGDESIMKDDNYWESLADTERELLLQRYVNLSGFDVTSAWCKLQAQCNESIARSLLSQDEHSHHWALKMLEKVYRRDGDIFAQEEKDRVCKQLEKLFNVHGKNANRAIRIGTRNLSEQANKEIREDVSMKEERFEDLAKMIWDKTRAFERARYRNKKQTN